MKKLLMLLAMLLGLGILAPTTAQAGGCRTRCYTDNCGYTVYSEYRFVGRDCHGCPIYRWVVVNRCAPRHYGHSDYGYNGYSRVHHRLSHYGRSHYGYGRGVRYRGYR